MNARNGNVTALAIVGLAAVFLMSCLTDTMNLATQTMSSIGEALKSPEEKKIDAINNEIAAAKTKIAQLTSDRKAAEAMRNEAIYELGKLTGTGARIPRPDSGEDLFIDKGMMISMHNNNAAAAKAQMDKLDAEIASTYVKINSLTAERARLEAAAKTAKEMAASTAIGCFTPDTGVLTSSGPVPIAAVKPGQVLTVYDESNRILASKPVVEVYRFRQDHYYILNGEIRVTGMHRFLTEDGWVCVKDLKIETKLKTATGWKELEKIELVMAALGVVNLQVEEHHDFFVVAGADQYLVHNTGGGGGGSK
jgi:hypothetical protein